MLRAYETQDQGATSGENIRLAIRLHEDFVREQFAKTPEETASRRGREVARIRRRSA